MRHVQTTMQLSGAKSLPVASWEGASQGLDRAASGDAAVSPAQRLPKRVSAWIPAKSVLWSVSKRCWLDSEG